MQLYDIYGLTEIYGPGIGISCDYEMRHALLCDDYVYFEIDRSQDRRSPCPRAAIGELVITTLQKEGAPLIRYRTHDLTRVIPGRMPLRQPVSAHRH